ncbi:uncharacterized protein PAC_09985 [Phialocephala subalpina]|uniref:Glycosyl hydrolase family 13 catalytic domain-containing protein n=1 Tax=Phialocephala subalpina TaxID=576137 RepID=A0A1L7X4Z4_9HELO|nr:uncharacterized protein PAC_09985 [Phialocephala subalpina]
MPYDLLERRKAKFVLWTPGVVAVPSLILGTIDARTSPATFSQLFEGQLVKADRPDLWELDPNTIQPRLRNGIVYHYWFQVVDTSPEHQGTIKVTDPIAYTVDYRITTVRDDHVPPPAVIKFRDGKLWPCDIDGGEPSPVAVPPQDNIPDNNHLVIYELPASWAKSGTDARGVNVDIGTFKDVLALFDAQVAGDRFTDIPQVANEAILSELGINCLELLPAADAKPEGEWGYATAHYYAPDFDLGPSSDLVQLVETIHGQNTRFFTDVVMAFGHDPYVYIDFDQFHLQPCDPTDESDNWQSHRANPSQLRDGYVEEVVHPSWAFHQGHLYRWMSDFGVGGLRLDSVNNIANYDFIKAYKEYAWSLYQARYASASNAKFLVIGEELADPIDMISTGTLNALWNEPWQGRLRALIIADPTISDFAGTVRLMANCTLDPDHPFSDGAQAVNYITSHDVEGFRKERLYNFLDGAGVVDKETRAKLAFALLLTAVGIPMIFAGEEFVDQMDRPIGQKQIDPVNYERKAEPWRSAVFNYVANLVRFREQCPALGDDDTNFFFTDGSRGGKIMAWTRGAAGHEPVVVVANFSDENTPGTEYVVPGWPNADRDDWREVSQGRNVPKEWVGREPLMKWEVKIYTYWKSA